MIYNPDNHHRQSIRLKGHNYSQAGAYFVTICSWKRECLFGEVVNGEMRLNEQGGIAYREWHRSSVIRKEIELDIFVIMPNHIHGIVIIHTNPLSAVEANGRSPLRMEPKSISSFIAGYKSSVTKRINQIRNTPSMPLWQRNYYERIIRNEDELSRVREYILHNPVQWPQDENNPVNMKR